MRKVLVSLLVVAMVLGLVSSAAAAFTDTASAAAAKYIDKAAAFGWLKGYPDGTFKPAGNITRAEFAAVVVRALGLDAAAASTSGLSTKFADVPKTHWAAGYINVATNKGVIKGYPDGSFKPEANVSNAEAITMIVRALNRESEATGEWPVGHISVAASNSIIGSGFVSNALATRGDVATYVSKAADVKWKELTTNGWVDSVDKTFLKANNLELIEGNVSSTDVGNKTVTIAITGGATNTYTMADGAVIGGGISLLDIRGYGVDAFKNKDTGKLVFIEQSTDTTAKKGTIRAREVGFKDANTGYSQSSFFYLYDDSSKYVLSSNASVVRNGNGATFDQIAVDDDVTFFIGADGNVSYVSARGYDLNRAVITDLYTAGTPYSITVRKISGTPAAFSTVTYTVASDAKVELNGAEAKFTDLAKNNVVSISLQTAGGTTASILNASNKTVTGKVTAKRTTVSEDGTRAYVSIDGVEYRLESTSEVKDDTTYTRAITTSGTTGTPPVSYTNNGYFDKFKVGQTVTLSMSQRNRARVVEFVSGVADMGKIKRFVTGTANGYDQWVMDMKGTETTYEIAKQDSTSLFSHLTSGHGIAVGDYVALTIDVDGRISDAEKLVTISPTTTIILGDVYGGDKIVTIGGKAYLITNDTLLYVNDVVGSVGSLAKDQKAAVAYSTDTTSIKLRALIVDTFAKLDTSSMVATQTSLKGYQNAAEYGARVEVWADASMNTTRLGYTTADKADASGFGWAGGFSINFKDNQGDGTNAVSIDHGKYVYVKVIDAFGNTTSAPVMVP